MLWEPGRQGPLPSVELFDLNYSLIRISGGEPRKEHRRMKRLTRDPAALLPLKRATYQVLLALADGESLHGYAIMQAVAAMTDGRETILPGTLYAALARMVDEGLVEESDRCERRCERWPDRAVLPPHQRSVAPSHAPNRNACARCSMSPAHKRSSEIDDVISARGVAPLPARFARVSRTPSRRLCGRDDRHVRARVAGASPPRRCAGRAFHPRCVRSTSIAAGHRRAPPSSPAAPRTSSRPVSTSRSPGGCCSAIPASALSPCSA